MKNNPLNNPFKVPKNYFDTIADQLSLKIKAGNPKDQTFFIVPQDYFENIEGKIKSKLIAEKKETKHLKHLIQRFAIAASFLILYLTNPFSKTDSDNELIASYADELLMYNTIDFMDAYADENIVLGFEENETINKLNNINLEYYPDLSNPWNYAELDQ